MRRLTGSWRTRAKQAETGVRPRYFTWSQGENVLINELKAQKQEMRDDRLVVFPPDIFVPNGVFFRAPVPGTHPREPWPEIAAGLSSLTTKKKDILPAGDKVWGAGLDYSRKCRVHIARFLHWQPCPIWCLHAHHPDVSSGRIFERRPGLKYHTYSWNIFFFCFPFPFGGESSLISSPASHPIQPCKSISKTPLHKPPKTQTVITPFEPPVGTFRHRGLQPLPSPHLGGSAISAGVLICIPDILYRRHA